MVKNPEAEEKAQKGGAEEHIHRPALDKPHWHKTHHLDTSEYMFTLLCILHLKSTEPRGGIHNSLSSRFEVCSVSLQRKI